MLANSILHDKNKMAREIKEKIEKGAVHAVFIIEMAGRPAEHVEKTLKDFVDFFTKQKGIDIINKVFHEPHPVENLFSCFVEIEFIAENLSKLLNLIFEFMPSSVEIIEPEHLKVNIADANAFVNDLTTRLHHYDAIAKKVQIEKLITQKQFEEELKKAREEKLEGKEEKLGEKEEKQD